MINNMFMSALERAFDEYFEKKYAHKSPNNTMYSDPNTMTEYREELQKFAQFLIEEYEQSIQDLDYWENRYR